MTGRLREELRREAATARTYDVYARSLLTARRTVAVWAVVVAALALVVPIAGRATQPVVVADGGAPSLPARLGLPAYGSLDATAYPHLGAASVLFTGEGARFGNITDDTDRYRTLHQDFLDGSAVLSPDGRTVADAATRDRRDDRSVIPLTDLTTGRVRWLPGTASRTIAWSPDARRLAIEDISADGSTGALRILDVADGRTGREVAGPDLPAIPGGLPAALLGWRDDGTALVFAGHRVLGLAPGTATPVTVMTVPDQVQTLDLADQAIAGGLVRPGHPPFPVGPWLRIWAAGLLLAVPSLVLWSRNRRDRARRGRMAAVPWGTTNGEIA